ncbi:MAG: tetratricopeptide repeat protein [Proteobacteria bacterium]|nr:tetratricopeptide repeat protein [Pseudomonadota bacterium]
MNLRAPAACPAQAAMAAVAMAASALALPAAAQSIGAQPFDYSPDRDPALQPCDERYHRGERAEAAACYTRVSAESLDGAVRAEAAWRLGDLQAANAFFRTALELDPESFVIRERWGRLFLATHQADEAARLFTEALELNEDYTPARLGIAAVALGRFEDRARTIVEEVLEGDGRHIEAHLISARLSLENGGVDAAREALDEALDIADAQDLPPLEVYSLHAAADVLQGITTSEWTDRALAYNPSYGEIHATPAYYYLINRRYREAVELLFEAVRIQPDLWTAHAELGVNLFRQNRVEEAQAHLALAYQGDPFSAQTVNTLRLLDSLENFVVLRRELPEREVGAGVSTQVGAEVGTEGETSAVVSAETSAAPGETAPPGETTAVSGETTTPPGMLLRLHKDEAPVIDAYVTDLVADSVQAFTERYQFELQEDVVVELYPEHDDFAVRTLGLPGIGLLGVAFGYLVAMDSPSGSREGEFHWGTTLWHEIAHIFTLEATGNLVPRWFSEGVSVFEEWSTGPLPGRHIPVRVLEAMADDRFLPVAELDGGFMRPTYEGQVIVSYTQAGLLCQYIAREWGQQGLVDMLNGFADGLSTAGAIREGLGVAPEELDRGFREFLEVEFRTTLDGLEEWREYTRATYEALDAEDFEAVIERAESAIAAYPDYVDDGDGYIPKALALDELDRRPEAMDTLETYWRLGGYSPGALRRLGAWLHDAGRPQDAIAVYDDLIMVTPLDAEVHTTLGDWMLAEGMADGALREYRALMATQPHDMAGAHYRLATAFLALEDQARTREHLLYALEIAPHYREAQQLLLEIVR